MNTVSLYAHIPFCSRKCLFCSFVVSVGSLQHREEYVQALIKEASLYHGQKIKSIYLGGGTPSLLLFSQLQSFFEHIYQNFDIIDGAEITIEANSETIDQEKVQQWQSLGINRVSLGVQTMREQYLRFLGRNHDAKTALTSWNILKSAGFKNLNVDFMYAFPGQTQEELDDDLQAVMGFDSQHISLYTLTIEPNSKFYAKQVHLDDDEKLADRYTRILDVLEKGGYHQYEISNFCKPGFESTHNINYWQGNEYIGLGAGAHGYINGKRYWNQERLHQYIESITQQGQAVSGHEILTEETKRAEKILFGLRMNKGIDPALIPEGKQKIVNDLIEQDFLKQEGNILKTTIKGRLVLDEISVRLI